MSVEEGKAPQQRQSCTKKEKGLPDGGQAAAVSTTDPAPGPVPGPQKMLSGSRMRG